MASPGKQVHFQEAPGDDNALVVFNKGAVDRNRKRSLSRTISRLSMESTALQSDDEEEGQNRGESVVSLMKKS